MSNFQQEEQWQKFLHRAYEFWSQRDYMHWKTDSLLPSWGVDAYIDGLKAQGLRTGRSWYLPSSPELQLKMALIKGAPSLFEIKNVYRDDDRSPYHSVEFTMLEWYQKGADKWALLEDIKGFVQSETDQELSIQRFSVAQLFEALFQEKIIPQMSSQDWQSLLDRHGIEFLPDDDIDDLYTRAFVERIEPFISSQEAIVITDYPPFQCSLSAISPEGWADRYELYWQGVELANIYQEQMDGSKILSTLRREEKRYEDKWGQSMPKDALFEEAISKGFMVCAGGAMGLERLWSLLNGDSSIQPWKKGPPIL